MQLQSKIIESVKGRLRRNRTLMQLIRGRQVPAAKGQLRIDQAKLRIAIRNNRDTLKTVTNWIDPDSFEKSVCAYGMSLSTRGVINDAIGPQTTYSDLMAYFCKEMPLDPNYLEIGVSVGKNFWQLLNCVERGNFWGFDIENINPVLKSKLSFTSQTKIRSSFKSSRVEEPHVSRFSYEGKTVRYSAGDVYDDDVWQMFDGQKFSLIFSDASHTPAALRTEWKQISGRSLLDQRGFTIVWDDLGSPGMRDAFNDIVVDCGKDYRVGQRNACLAHVYGWVGSAEPFHPIGIISTHGFVS
ncbi:MAG TPA: hypothetical protein VN920_14935 [Pyrinomonadaceae bacterium]|nr:hypothetical protein [Pyrinomonadaceae bacterium]